ncbi:hypothetical protein OAT86_03180 [Planktomarina sp.]|nr:hypothetical protein [Planktomarina temperata]MDC3222241.1 hypothetical protein [Planktomarina sp.]
MEYAKVHSACASYIGYLYKDYTGAGFASEEDARQVQDKHFQLAGDAGEKFVSLAISQDLDGKRFITKKGKLFCFVDTCFAKREYIEAMFILAGPMEAEKEIAEKDIKCPEGTWLPCVGKEPVENRYRKAVNLYKTRNCSLLLP